jgi:RNA polymerase sigma-70 factor (ECF subfamily)
MSNEPAFQEYPGPDAKPGETPAKRLEFSDIVRAHGPALRGRALWLSKSASDAADLFQETIERALRRPRRELRPETVLRWLYTIMHNAFLDSCRARAVRRWIPLDRLEERLAQEEQPGPARWRHVDDCLLHRCIARLPGRLRAVVQMHLQGLTYTELARALAVPTSTVGTRLLRAKRRLRQLLGSFFPEEAGPGNKSSPPRNAGGGYLAG